MPKAEWPMRKLLQLGIVVISLANAQARADPVAAVEDGGIKPDSFARNLPHNADANGVRKWLAEKGIAYSFVYTNEVLRNLSGGLRRGAFFQGKLDGQLSVDLEKFAGLSGWSFYTNVFQIHRTRGARNDFTGGLVTVSNIEAVPTTRLSELWLEKKLLSDKASIRFGQLAADQEFFIASFGTFFINSDWPTITASDLPGGGPAYPMASPGVRLRYDPTKNFTFLTALFNGNPAPRSTLDPQRANLHGVKFPIKDPPLWLSEVQYRYNQDAGLAGSLRLGAWHHFGKFDSLHYGIDGLSLASPFSNGLARRFRGNDGVYAVLDQQLYRLPDGGPDSGISVFSRISKAMSSNRNLIDYYADGGVVFSGMVPGRPDDKFGATFIYAHVSRELRRLDRDFQNLQGIAKPLHSGELTFEISYLAQITKGWQIQPDIQYVRRPGGGTAFPNDPTQSRRIKDAKLIGLRSTFTW